MSSWSSYVLKLEIPWHVFCSSLFLLILCIPVHEKHKHFLIWKQFVSDHGAATAWNRESLGTFFVSLCLYIYIFFSVRDKNKKLLVWEHVVSDHGEATSLNSLTFYIVYFYLFILICVFLFMKSITIFTVKITPPQPPFLRHLFHFLLYYYYYYYFILMF